MSINNTFNSIESNLLNAYNALINKGATIPQNKNLDNLANTINTVTGSDVYLFNGYDEMMNTTLPVQNHYALLYGNGNLVADISSVIEEIVFPDTIKLTKSIIEDKLSDIDPYIVNDSLQLTIYDDTAINNIPTGRIAGKLYIASDSTNQSSWKIDWGEDENKPSYVIVQFVFYKFNSIEAARSWDANNCDCYYITYKSDDGVVFTRDNNFPLTDSIINVPKTPQSFSGSNLSFNSVLTKPQIPLSSDNWNLDDLEYDIVPRFMRISNNINIMQNFNYYNTYWNSVQSQLTVSPEDVWQDTFIGPKGYQRGTLQDVKYVKSGDEYRKWKSVSNQLSYLTPASNNLSYAFDNYSGTEIPGINTENVIDFSYMFNNATNLINVPYFNTYSAQSMINMFNNTPNLNLSPNNLYNLVYSFPNYSQLNDTTTNKLSYFGLNLNEPLSLEYVQARKFSL